MLAHSPTSKQDCSSRAVWYRQFGWMGQHPKDSIKLWQGEVDEPFCTSPCLPHPVELKFQPPSADQEKHPGAVHCTSVQSSRSHGIQDADLHLCIATGSSTSSADREQEFAGTSPDGYLSPSESTMTVKNPANHRTTSTNARKEKSPFYCHLCPYCTRRKSDLSRHIRAHTHERPFSCSICLRTFSRKEYLVAHVHAHTRKRFK